MPTSDTIKSTCKRCKKEFVRVRDDTSKDLCSQCLIEAFRYNPKARR